MYVSDTKIVFLVCAQMPN